MHASSAFSTTPASSPAVSARFFCSIIPHPVLLVLGDGGAIIHALDPANCPPSILAKPSQPSSTEIQTYAAVHPYPSFAARRCDCLPGHTLALHAHKTQSGHLLGSCSPCLTLFKDRYPPLGAARDVSSTFSLPSLLFPQSPTNNQLSHPRPHPPFLLQQQSRRGWLEKS